MHRPAPTLVSMQFRSRAVALAALGVGPLLLAAGCGGTSASGPTATLARIQPTSFVEVEPATTTTTTTLPPDFTPEAGTRSPVEQVYTIKSGDSLGAIAARYDISLDQLVNYNQFPNGSSQLILPGDQIKIPPDSLVPGTATETADSGTGTDDGGDEATAEEASSGDCPTTYTIQSGDNTRIGVAERFGITYQEMDAANANTPGYSSFVVGTQITIPCPS